MTAHQPAHDGPEHPLIPALPEPGATVELSDSRWCVGDAPAGTRGTVAAVDEAGLVVVDLLVRTRVTVPAARLREVTP